MGSEQPTATPDANSSIAAAIRSNAPRALWSRWIAPDAENRIPLACRCLLVKGLDGKNVLFETGIGAFFEPTLRERYGATVN